MAKGKRDKKKGLRETAVPRAAAWLTSCRIPAADAAQIEPGP